MVCSRNKKASFYSSAHHNLSLAQMCGHMTEQQYNNNRSNGNEKKIELFQNETRINFGGGAFLDNIMDYS